MRREIMIGGILVLVLGIAFAAGGTRTIYQDVERTETILDYNADKVLEPGYYRYWHTNLEVGDIIFGDLTSDNDVYFYIFSNEQFNEWQTSYYYSPNAPSLVTRKQTTSASFSAHVDSTDTYYIVAENRNHYTGEKCTFSIEIERTYIETIERKDYSINVVGMFLAIFGFVIALVGYSSEEGEGLKLLKMPKSSIAKETSVNERICQSCGLTAPDGVEFCPHCGAEL
jgi:hypothetical protein